MPNSALELLRDLSHEVRGTWLVVQRLQSYQGGRHAAKRVFCVLDLNGASVDVLHFPFDPLDFYRDYVAASKPVLIKGALTGAPFLDKWSTEYLLRALGDTQVTVAVTPDGRADAVAAKVDEDGSHIHCFAMPLEEKVPFRDFVEYLQSRQKLRESDASCLSKQDIEAAVCPPDQIRLAGAVDNASVEGLEQKRREAKPELDDRTTRGGSGEVLYMQQQNNNMFGPEMQGIRDDIPQLPWAARVFGNDPDAVNFWMGADESVTSFHRDHYENLYAVTAGQKVFTLLPPCDSYRLYMQEYAVGKYIRQNGKLALMLQEGSDYVRWSSVDPVPPLGKEVKAMLQHPLFFDPGLPAPLQATVGKGDMLYLPAMWFHHVRQIADGEGRVIAVNWWHDMRWDLRAAYSRLVDRMCQ